MLGLTLTMADKLAFEVMKFANKKAISIIFGFIHEIEKELNDLDIIIPSLIFHVILGFSYDPKPTEIYRGRRQEVCEEINAFLEWNRPSKEDVIGLGYIECEADRIQHKGGNMVLSRN